MQSVPYADVIKIYGVPRSGTTYLKELIQLNFDVLVLEDHLGFQHGQVIKQIDWEGLDWPNPDYWSEQRIKFLMRTVEQYKDDIQERFDWGKLYFVFIIKNPYAWYHSIRLTSKAPFEPLCLKNIYHWNERNRHYLEYYEEHPKNTFIVRYEDFYQIGYTGILTGLENLFSLTKTGAYKNIAHVVSQKTAESDKGEFDMKKYQDKFYLDKLGLEVIQGITDHVDEELMNVFNYEYE